MQEHQPIESFLDAVGAIRATRAGTPETAYYPAVANLFDAIGKTLRPRVLCVPHPARGNAGIPDFGLFEQTHSVAASSPRGWPRPHRSAGAAYCRRTRGGVFDECADGVGG